MSVFYSTRNFRQFWADPTFSGFRSTLLAEEDAQKVEILPHPKILPFLGRPLKDVRFYPILNFGHFGAPSLVTLLTFQKTLHLEHPNTQTPEHLNGHEPCFCENVANKHGLLCLSRPQCLSLLFYFCLSWFSSMCFLLFFVLGNSSWLSFCAPTTMVLDIVEGQKRGRVPKRKGPTLANPNLTNPFLDLMCVMGQVQFHQN